MDEQDQATNGEDRRRSPRKYMLFEIPAYDAETRKLMGVVQDITEKGLQLEGYEVEKNATKAIVIDISSYLKGSRLSLVAQCRWCRQEGPPGNYASEFEITAIAENQKKSLLKLIDAMALG